MATTSELTANDSTTAALTELNKRLMSVEERCAAQRNEILDNLTAIRSNLLQLNDNLSNLNERQEMFPLLNESVVDLHQMLEQNMLLLNQYTGLPSCAALPPSFPSGYYWVRASNGSAVREYCDMTRSCGEIPGGWTRVAELNTTSNGHQCPSGLTQCTDGDIRTCVRDTSTAGCSSVTFPTQSISYSRVCGRITGYH